MFIAFFISLKKLLRNYFPFSLNIHLSKILIKLLFFYSCPCYILHQEFRNNLRWPTLKRTYCFETVYCNNYVFQRTQTFEALKVEMKGICVRVNTSNLLLNAIKRFSRKAEKYLLEFIWSKSKIYFSVAHTDIQYCF